mmetsp:Transcript_36417/g.58762  ORF Transcript_36417/g.58762 Transcript_36417/m.58762 type:complete len:89 (-) Transcript_36417:1075-1341(-)
MLQHTAPYCNILQHTLHGGDFARNAALDAATLHIMLQHAATCCNTLYMEDTLLAIPPWMKKLHRPHTSQLPCLSPEHVRKNSAASVYP